VIAQLISTANSPDQLFVWYGSLCVDPAVFISSDCQGI